ncbi:MAG: HAMP domain-containing protein [Proteobacteria bacterium]|nr:HAMP domain-containing protein [Pseudomonadota bacterium]
MMRYFRSMSGRVFLILLAGVLASAALTWWLAFGERQRTMSQFRETRVLEQLEQFVLALDAVPPTSRPAFVSTVRRFGPRAELLPAGDMPAQAQEGFARLLSERLGAGFSVATLPQPATACLPRGRGASVQSELTPPHPLCDMLVVRLRDGAQVRLRFVLPRGALPPLRPDFFIYLALFMCSIAALAYWVARMSTAPLKQLAHAAEGLGNNLDQPPLPQQGTSEIRLATAAFNAMQTRLREHIRQRTQMLAAITHDLQTPLTRLRLRLEKVEDTALRERLIEDLAHTQAIVREGLDLARSVDASEALQPLAIDSLLDSVCSDAADAGQPVTLDGHTGLTLPARPVALRRCLTNLIDNAVQYGQAARVAVLREMIDDRTWVRIAIRDNGPGIPEAHLQQVFEPFHRLESSRSRQTGGTGLGLTIAANIAAQHGGSITLANHPEGGLEAVLLLPS